MPPLTSPSTSCTRWLVAMLLVAPVVAIFAPVLFADRSFGFRDGAHFYHPLFQWIAREWGQGRMPLWNPQENCGLPVLADATSSIFYPGKIIFALPLPFSWLYKLYVIGHVLLAGVGMYAFARRMQASAPAATLAAVAYACGGNVVFQYCNVVFLVGAAWLPLALLAIEEIVKNRCWRAMFFFAFVLAMMILGGDPQMAYHALLAAGLRWVFAWFGGAPSTRSLPMVDAGTNRLQRFQIAVLLAGAAVIAFLLAAVQILPSSAATKGSERVAYNRPRNVYEAAAVVSNTPANQSLLAESASEKITAGILGQPEPTSHHDRAYNFSISPWRVIEFFWPNVSGRIFPTQRSWITFIPGGTSPWTPTMYLGLLPLLAGLAAFRLRKAEATTRWLSSLVLIFALGSLGWYGLGWALREGYSSMLRGDSSKLSIGCPVGGVYWLMVTLLPTYIYFRYPAKLMVVAVCSLCGLAAVKSDCWFTTRSPRLTKVLQWFASISALAAFVIWCASPYLVQQPVKIDRIFGPFDWSGSLFDVISAFVHAAVIAWVLHLLLKRMWEAAEQGHPLKTSWAWAAVTLTAAELAIANAWLVVAAPASMWETTGPVARSIQDEAKVATDEAPPRFFRGSYHAWQPSGYVAERSNRRLQDHARWESATLFPKYHLVTGLPLIESYGSLKSLDYESLLHVARNLSSTEVDRARVPIPEALRLTSCEYLVLPASADLPFADRIPIPDSASLPENVSLWRMKRTLPRAQVVYHVVQLPPLTKPLDIAAVDVRAKDVLTETRDGKLVARDFRQLAVVETDAKLLPGLLSETNSPSTTAATILQDQPQHVRIRAQLARPGLLVLADSFGEGWIATRRPAETNGSDAAAQNLVIYRTNRCFRGVELPAGDWLIDFDYRPQSFYRGALVSGVAWLGLIVAAVIGSFRRGC